MKIIIINASPHKHGHCETAASELQQRLTTQEVESEIVWLCEKNIPGCLACDQCMKLDACIQKDDIVNQLADKIEQADGLMVCAPVYFGGPNGQLCNAFDRIFYSRTVKDQRFQGKPAGAITVCNTMGAETALMGIYRYYNTCQMPIVSGVGYPTLTMQMIEEKNERFQTVIQAATDNMAKMLKKEDS